MAITNARLAISAWPKLAARVFDTVALRLAVLLGGPAGSSWARTMARVCSKRTQKLMNVRKARMRPMFASLFFVVSALAPLPAQSQATTFFYHGQVRSTSGIGAPSVSGARCEVVVHVNSFISLGEPNCSVHVSCLGTTAYANDAARCQFGSFSAGLVFRRTITTVQMADDQGSRQDGSPRMQLDIPRGLAVISEPPPEPYLSGWGMSIGPFRQQL